MRSLAMTRALDPEDYPMPGLIFFTGSRLVRIVEVPQTSARCYVMVESIATGERYPLTIALLRELLQRHPFDNSDHAHQRTPHFPQSSQA